MTANFWNSVRGIIRVVIRIIIEVFHRVLLNIFDLLFGFFNWPRKKLRIKIFILPNEEQNSLVSPTDLDRAIVYTTKVFSKNFNIKLLAAQKNEPLTEILKTIPPSEVLYTRGGAGALSEEFKTTGNFFAAHLVAPIYPVTVFVVMNIKGASGCSLGPMTDYITLDHRGAKDESILAHELAHACGLWHLNHRTNLLWYKKDRGDKIRWWQRNIFRSSRHITYW